MREINPDYPTYYPVQYYLLVRNKKMMIQKAVAELAATQAIKAVFETGAIMSKDGIIFNKVRRYKKASKACREIVKNAKLGIIPALIIDIAAGTNIAMLSLLALDLLAFVGAVGFDTVAKKAAGKIPNDSDYTYEKYQRIENSIKYYEQKHKRLQNELEDLYHSNIIWSDDLVDTTDEAAVAGKDINLNILLENATAYELKNFKGLETVLSSEQEIAAIKHDKIMVLPNGRVCSARLPIPMTDEEYDIMWESSNNEFMNADEDEAETSTKTKDEIIDEDEIQPE